MLQRKSEIKKINRKSNLIISNRFLKFHLIESIAFYMVLFILPSFSIMECASGHSFLNYFAVIIFLAQIFIIDLSILKQYVRKETLKLHIEQFYGEQGVTWEYAGAMLSIYSKGFYELCMTQVNLVNTYTNVLFLSLVSKDDTLVTYFILSLTFIAVACAAKLFSFFVILRVVCSSNRKYKELNIQNN